MPKIEKGVYIAYRRTNIYTARRVFQELTRHAQEGGKAVILFMAALPQVTAFKPHREGDPVLSDLLEKAQSEGVMVRTVGLYFNPEDSSIHLFNPDVRVYLRSQSCLGHEGLEGS